MRRLISFGQLGDIERKIMLIIFAQNLDVKGDKNVPPPSGFLGTKTIEGNKLSKMGKTINMWNCDGSDGEVNPHPTNGNSGGNLRKGQSISSDSLGCCWFHHLKILPSLSCHY